MGYSARSPRASFVCVCVCCFLPLGGGQQEPLFLCAWSFCCVFFCFFAGGAGVNSQEKAATLLWGFSGHVDLLLLFRDGCLPWCSTSWEGRCPLIPLVHRCFLREGLWATSGGILFRVSFSFGAEGGGTFDRVTTCLYRLQGICSRSRSLFQVIAPHRKSPTSKTF